jgi:hypothetical protein
MQEGAEDSDVSLNDFNNIFRSRKNLSNVVNNYKIPKIISVLKVLYILYIILDNHKLTSTCPCYYCFCSLLLNCIQDWSLREYYRPLLHFHFEDIGITFCCYRCVESINVKWRGNITQLRKIILIDTYPTRGQS